MSRFRLLTVVSLILLTCTATVSAQDFYEQQLQTGKIAAAAGRNVEASDQLRIAAFGLLDRPALLSEALIRIALVQSALGHPAPIVQALDRFVLVEQRFKPYASLALDEQTKSAFEALVLKTLPRNVIATLPSLSRLVRSEWQQVSDLPVDRRAAAFEVAFKKESRNVEWPLAAARDAASRNAHADVVRWSERALSIDSANDDAIVLGIRARTARNECREAMAALNRLAPARMEQRPELFADQTVCLVSLKRASDAEAVSKKIPEALRTRPDVAAALQKIAAPKQTAQPKQMEAPKPTPPAAQQATRPPANVPVSSSQVPRTTDASDVIPRTRALVQQGKFIDAERALQAALVTQPSNRPLRLGLLEASVLAKDWKTAAAQATAVQPLAAGEELHMFYAAVALYETGRLADAKALMERARSKMASHRLVDHYLQAILGKP